MKSRTLQSVFYVLAGVNHFRSPVVYQGIIPPYLPDHSLLNILAGISEITLGILLMIRVTRLWAAYGIMLMLLAFLPVHIYHIQMNGCLPSLCFPVWVAWVRLLVVHPLLLYWAWSCRK